MNAEKIKIEIRKLNRIDKIEIYRWIDEEKASNLTSGPRYQENVKKVRGRPYRKRCHIPFDQYRVVVGGIGIVFAGGSVSESRRQFRLFMEKSKSAESFSARVSVTLFKNYEIIKEYHPPDGPPAR